VIEKELTAQENKIATGMLRKETLKALAQNKSAFRGYFDNSAEMQEVTDEDVANVAAALTEM
jgi:enoyl-[acyl-carrier-protein] reductase (NADH)